MGDSIFGVLDPARRPAGRDRRSQARTGQPFDQAWIRAVLDLQKQVREAANAVLASPNASPEMVAAARAAQARLDAAVARLQQAAATSGATTPGSVPAGSGGQAADGTSVLPLGLIVLGVALVGGAVRWGMHRS